MTPHRSLLVVLPFTLSIIFFRGTYRTEALNNGFNIELIHRDSPKSPFYNSTETPFQRLTNAIHRSFYRVNHFYPQILQGSPYPESEITNLHGEFLIKYAIGSPPLDVMAIADTGSDWIWLQCMPCDPCYHQNSPIFDPSQSSSYENVHCSSKVCGLIHHDTFCNPGEKPECLYKAIYVDGSNSKGNVAFETFTLGSNVTNTFISFLGVLFGCGHGNDGFTPTLSNSIVAGIVGLGAGVNSLTSQLSTSFDNKFSYCFVPLFDSPHLTSKLYFGENAVVSGPGTVSTPIASGPVDTFYYLTLLGMSVGSKRVDLVTSGGVEGNIVIDSGSTLTYLPEDFYTRLEAEVAAQINSPRASPTSKLLRLCYSSNTPIEVPIITAHFKGADIVLKSNNTFVSLGNNLVCFTFSPSSKFSIYGSTSQWNFLVGYDRTKKIVSFKTVDCTNF